MMTQEAREIFERLPDHIQQYARPSLGIRLIPSSI